MQKVGLITIAQTPITGIDKDINYFLPNRKIEHYGALDGLTEEEIQNVLAKENEHVLTAELSDKSFVKLSKEKLIPLLQHAIARSEENGNMINILLCTSLFPEFKYDGVLIEPGKLQGNMNYFVSQSANVCALVPTKKHINQVKNKWKEINRKVDVRVMHPSAYQEKDIKSAEDDLCNYNVVILDCAAYNVEFTELLKKYFDGLIICPLDLSLNVAFGLTQ